MKTYDQLTPTGKFFRKNIVRLLIYGGFVAACAFSYNRVKENQEEAEYKPVVVELAINF